MKIYIKSAGKKKTQDCIRNRLVPGDRPQVKLLMFRVGRSPVSVVLVAGTLHAAGWRGGEGREGSLFSVGWLYCTRVIAQYSTIEPGTQIAVGGCTYQVACCSHAPILLYVSD